jgi:hypothetical protein
VATEAAATAAPAAAEASEPAEAAPEPTSEAAAEPAIAATTAGATDENATQNRAGEAVDRGAAAGEAAGRAGRIAAPLVHIDLGGPGRLFRGLIRLLRLGQRSDGVVGTEGNRPIKMALSFGQQRPGLAPDRAPAGVDEVGRG